MAALLGNVYFRRMVQVILLGMTIFLLVLGLYVLLHWIVPPPDYPNFELPRKLKFSSLFAVALSILSYFFAMYLDIGTENDMRKSKVTVDHELTEDGKVVELRWKKNASRFLGMQCLGYYCGLSLPATPEDAKAKGILIVNDDLHRSGTRKYPVAPGVPNSFVFFLQGTHWYREGLFFERGGSKIIQGRMTTVQVLAPADEAVTLQRDVAKAKQKRALWEEENRMKSEAIKVLERIRDEYEAKTIAFKQHQQIIDNMNADLAELEKLNLPPEIERKRREAIIKHHTDHANRLRGLS